MNKKYAFLLSILITLFLASFLYFIQLSQKDSGRETIRVGRVIDGDTLKSADGRTFRLLNINTPEKNVAGANLSRDFLKQFENKTVQIEIISTDKYDRYLVRIYSPSYINLELVKSGMASKFLVEDSELKSFANAEKEAIIEGRGIWVKSQYFGCIESEIDPREEIIILKNICEANTSGWYLKDESRKIYYLDKSFSEVRLHSGKGETNTTDLFWQSATDVWNNDRDSLYVFDREGKIVHYNSYGY